MTQENFQVDQFVLEHCFHRLERNGEVYYWRECVQRPDMRPDEVGYIVLFSNGDHFHTYHNPVNFL